MQYTFEWDADKALGNVQKHGVTFEEAAGIMQDPLALSIYDETHSSGEDERWVTIGEAGAELLVVVHTFRDVGTDEALVRIISARRATRNERRQYEDGR